MASHQNASDRIANMQTRTLQNQPTAQESSMSLGEDLADTDEPPDEQQPTPRPTPVKPTPLGVATNFTKTRCGSRHHNESLLTQALHSESDSQSDDDHHVQLKRGMSTASTWSNVSAASTDLTSDGGFTSPGTRTSSPSPPLPPTIHGLPLITIKRDPELALNIRHTENIAEKIENKPVKPADDHPAEAGLGRRRCITFACGKKESSANAAPAKPQSPAPKEKPAEPAVPRRCTIKFACDSKALAAAKKTRMASPPPPPSRLAVPGKGAPRSHRGSDSTVRNESPKSLRKSASVIRHSRKFSENSDIGRREATRFHEFASSEEEVEEWTQEQTCHKMRLTVSDTLKIENGLRKLGEEVEEEALEDDEDEDEELLDEDDEDLDLDEDEDEDEDEDAEDGDESDNESVISDGSVSDGGFQTDDEEGFAGSDDESDAGSDYQWWAPGRVVAPSPGEQPEHIRPSGHRSLSDSSTCSVASGSAMFTKGSPARKRKPVNIHPRSPELPDSTDFVCGTFDEDRPLEDAYYSALEQRRAAKRKQTPQDIDPTFPTSDPEMDEEDEDDEVERAAEDSDQHMLMHGQLDQIDDVEGRGRRRAGPKRSPISSPKRLRSPPPPVKRGQAHRSPPPRRLFGQSPKRLRSPLPAGRFRSPPHMGRTFLDVTCKGQKAIQFAGMDQGPAPTLVASLPRPPTLFHQASYDDDEEGETTTNDTLKRGPMDIKAGTALKQQRRREKLYQKHCRKACKEKERRPAPGKGAERMREVGMGLAAYRGKKATPVHVLSY